MKQGADLASKNFAKSADFYGFRRVQFRLVLAKNSFLIYSNGYCSTNVDPCQDLNVIFARQL